MPISAICFLVQIACLSSILYTKVRCAIEDKKRQRSNTLGQLGPSGTDEEARGQESEQTRTRRGKQSREGARNGVNDIEMDAANNSFRTTNGNKVVRLNTSAHNKIFLDVSQFFFLVLIVAVTITCVAVNRQFKGDFKMGGYSRVLLCFLDLAPRISMSVLLPVAVYVSNPEIQNYIRGLFKCQRLCSK